MDKIKEVMGLAKEYGDACEAFGDYQVKANAEDCAKAYGAIESKLRELLEREPIAHLWQHGETGRTRVVMPDMVFTADANWLYVGPLVLGIGNESKEM